MNVFKRRQASLSYVYESWIGKKHNIINNQTQREAWDASQHGGGKDQNEEQPRPKSSWQQYPTLEEMERKIDDDVLCDTKVWRFFLPETGKK